MANPVIKGEKKKKKNSFHKSAEDFDDKGNVQNWVDV